MENVENLQDGGSRPADRAVWYHTMKVAMPLVALSALWLIASLGVPQVREGRIWQISPAARNSGDSCMGCHPKNPLFSHPVGIAPSMAVPAELPLDNGRVTCLTCHEDGGPASHDRAVQTHDGMLRSSAGSAERLCSLCHSSSTEVGAKKMHPLGLNRAHLTASSAGTPSATGLDEESRTCVSCHDGTLAIGVSDGMGVGTSRSGEHPVGVAYGDPSFNRMSDMRLVSAVTLDTKVRLFDAKVGCGSCHSLYSKESKYLVMSNLGSRLCLSCHGGR